MNSDPHDASATMTKAMKVKMMAWPSWAMTCRALRAMEAPAKNLTQRSRTVGLPLAKGLRTMKIGEKAQMDSEVFVGLPPVLPTGDSRSASCQTKIG
jgi:hypothetical protein